MGSHLQSWLSTALQAESWEALPLPAGIESRDRLRTRLKNLPKLSILCCAKSATDRSDLHGLLASDDDAKSWRRAEALLAGGNDDVDTPVVHLDLLACDCADGVENDERFGGDPFHGIGHHLGVRKHT